VVGKWVPRADKRLSSIIDGTSKWIGPMWSQIDENMIFRYTPAKTQFTSGATVTLDLRTLPMVIEELAHVPVEARRGPLIVNPRTSLPYRNWYYGEVWRQAVRSPASPRKSGIGTCGLLGSLKGGRRAHRMTIWPSRSATQTSGRRRRSMTATGWKRPAAWRKLVSPIEAKTQSERGVS
jgi:hypothetical protein